MQKPLYNGCSDNCCAWCSLHRCSMTFRQVRAKDCLNKQCRHLVKVEDHPVWQQRARIKVLRRERKAALSAPTKA